ncbi:MAG: aminopeptidase P family protein [Eggerthellaceae bacterium]|nr:aminopeptidase P family protein [Eggerthellaceae bacterium]
MGALSAQRQAVVRAACEQLGVTALLVRDTPNIRWITGFDGVFDEERAHALLVGRDFTSLHTDSRYSNALHEAVASTGSNIIVDEVRVGHFQFAHQSLAPGVDGAFFGKLGFEDSITYAEYVKAAGLFGTAALVPTNDVVLSLRSVKSPMELDRLRAAQAITDAAFRHIVGFMRPGMTEREVQLELEGYMMRCGADGLAFGSIVACGANGADPHAVPSDKRLEAGQCVVMDFGARAYGYCSDMTRVVFLGEPTGEMARAWDVLRKANETVERMLRPGVTGIEAHETAERVLEEGGFGGRMGHGLGHGVGLECHELPVLNTRNAAPLVEGNVVTVEPGIYLPGEFGMRLEDCGVITADGYEVFSQLGHEMVVI